MDDELIDETGASTDAATDTTTEIYNPEDYGFGSSGVGFDDTTDYAGYDYGYTQNPDGSSQRFNPDGSVTYQDPDGQVYTVNPTGTYSTSFAGKQYVYDPKQEGFVDSSGKLIQGGVNASVSGKSLIDRIKGEIAANPLATALTAAAAIKNIRDQANKTGGYNKPVPKMDVVREQIQYNDPNRRPGEGGRQYFTDTQFAPTGDAAALEAAKTAAAAQSAGILGAYQPRAAAEVNPYAGKMNLAAYSPAVAPAPAQQPPAPAAGLPKIPTQLTEQGGLGMAHGGIADAGRYLQGKTDGMADKIPSSIDGEQPAALSHGEFVIPADVVSHLGNGNSDAGAQKLYEMMDRIRQARTGTKEQGKEINPDEFTGGGIAAAYAGGGAVQGYAGPDGSAVVNPTVTTPPASSAGVPLDTSATSTLSPWVGEYATNALGQGAALAKQPYQAYTGQLTAGESDLQQQAFAGAKDIAKAGYTPTQFTGGLFNTQAAQQYMNPYLQASLDPQLKEMKRQADIQRVSDAGRLTKAGAYGGSRQAIMESEGARNLLTKQSDVLGQGYASAYDKAMAQFNADQTRQMEAQKATEASRQYGADFGLKSVGQLADLGATQRGITSEGLAADKKQFEEERDWMYKMPQYQLDLLSKLPIGASTTSSDQTGLAKIQGDIAGLTSIYKTLKELGQTPTTTPTAP